MPELPEVESLRRTLDRRLANSRVTQVKVERREVMRYPEPSRWEQWLAGAEYVAAGRRGKYLFLHWLSPVAGDVIMVAHLRMTGRLLVASAREPLLPHTHVKFNLADGRQLRYQDVRRFGHLALAPWPVMAPVAAAARLQPRHDRRVELDLPEEEPSAVRQLISPGLWKLGPEPWAAEFTPAYLKKKLARRRAAVKALLLDQRLVAGLGNIYVDEALFRAGIHPATPGGRLAAPALDRLHRAVVAVLEEAIRYGGTTLNDYRDADNQPGAMASRLQVYGQTGQPCRKCRAVIEKMRVAGRGTHFCPRCQGEETVD